MARGTLEDLTHAIIGFGRAFKVFGSANLFTHFFSLWWKDVLIHHSS